MNANDSDSHLRCKLAGCLQGLCARFRLSPSPLRLFARHQPKLTHVSEHVRFIAARSALRHAAAHGAAWAGGRRDQRAGGARVGTAAAGQRAQRRGAGRAHHGGNTARRTATCFTTCSTSTCHAASCRTEARCIAGAHAATAADCCAFAGPGLRCCTTRSSATTLPGRVYHVGCTITAFPANQCLQVTS